MVLYNGPTSTNPSEIATQGYVQTAISGLSSGGTSGTTVTVDGQPVATLDIDTTPVNQTDDTSMVHSTIAMNFQPFSVNSQTAPTSGAIYLSKLYVRSAATVTNIIYCIGAVGAGLVAGQNFVGLYNLSGTLLGVSADQSTNWASAASLTAARITPLVTPVDITPGVYFAAFLSNGTTAAAPGRTGSSGPLNVNLNPAKGYRWSQIGTAQTTLPATLNMGAATAYTLPTWWALS